MRSSELKCRDGSYPPSRRPRASLGSPSGAMARRGSWWRGPFHDTARASQRSDGAFRAAHGGVDAHGQAAARALQADRWPHCLRGPLRRRWGASDLPAASGIAPGSRAGAPRILGTPVFAFDPLTLLFSGAARWLRQGIDLGRPIIPVARVLVRYALACEEALGPAALRAHSPARPRALAWRGTTSEWP